MVLLDWKEILHTLSSIIHQKLRSASVHNYKTWWLARNDQDGAPGAQTLRGFPVYFRFVLFSTSVFSFLFAFCCFFICVFFFFTFSFFSLRFLFLSAFSFFYLRFFSICVFFFYLRFFFLFAFSFLFAFEPSGPPVKRLSLNILL